MANVATRMILSKTGKSFPLHLLRGSVSPASTNLNLQFQPSFPADPRSPQQIPLRVDESSAPIHGYNTPIPESRLSELNRMEVRGKSVSTEDDDDDDSDFEDISESDGDFPAEDFDEDEGDDVDLDDDEDDEVNVKRRK